MRTRAETKSVTDSEVEQALREYEKAHRLRSEARKRVQMLTVREGPGDRTGDYLPKRPWWADWF